MRDHEKRKPALPAALASRYVLEARLGDGASAEVWRGLDTVLGRPVAVKVLHRHLLADEATRDRLIREAQAAASLAHPNIVAVYDVAADDEGAALILELVDGDSVAARLQRDGILPARAAVAIAAEVSDALAHAHERGIVHRDVKTSNVILGPDGQARLTDFGIARLLDEAASGLTASGTMVGTLHALAPEQLRGELAGPASDIYAVGVLLTEMISGQPPFHGETPVAIAEAQRTPPLAIEGAPPELSAIIRATLDPDPAGRPDSAEELARQLRQWLIDDADPNPRAAVLHDAPTQPAIPLPALPPAVEPPRAVEPPPAVEPPREPPGRPEQGVRPGWLGAAAGLVLVGVGLLVFALANGGSPGLAADPSPTTSPSSAIPSATPQVTPLVTPAPPPSLADALSAFNRIVDDGASNGSVSGDAAERLRDALAEVADAADEGNRGKVNRALRDLRREIDELLADGEISPEVAASLDDAVNDIDAATG